MNDSTGPGLSAPGERPSQPDWLSPPENQVPVSLPVNSFFGRTGDVAVALVALQVYTTGLLLDIAIRVRRQSGDPARRLNRSAMAASYDDAPVGEMRLLLGVEYPDGRTAVNFPLRSGPAGPGLQGSEGPPVLVLRSGGGGRGVYDHTFWLAPVPGPGPLAVVFACAGLGVEESRIMSDGAAVERAAGEAAVLWPPEPDEEPETSYEPPVPQTGWFADAARRRRAT